MEGRVGAGVAQPWRDLRKLLAKETLECGRVPSSSAAAPLVLLASSLVVVRPGATGGNRFLAHRSRATCSWWCRSCWWVPWRWRSLGLDSGTAFGGMGSSRHMTIAALVEPTVLVAVYALSIPVGSSELCPHRARPGSHDPVSVASPVGLLAVGGARDRGGGRDRPAARWTTPRPISS